MKMNSKIVKEVFLLVFMLAGVILGQRLMALEGDFYIISGHVSDRAGNPAPNAHYVLRPEVGSNTIPVVTDANGNYSVNVAPNKYVLTRDPDNNPYMGYNILAPENTYFIDATNSNATQDFKYDTVGLSVTFVDQNNTPIQNAVVTQTANGGGSTKFPVGLPDILYTYNGFSPQNATTNGSGTVGFTVLRGLDYNVCAVDPATAIDVCSIYRPTADSSSLTLTLPAHYVISGHVSDRAGNPAPNAHYVLKAETGGNNIPIVTNANGDYSVNVIPNKYVLTRDPNNHPYKGFNILAPENTYFIDATTSNVTQDFQYDTVTLNVNFVDQNNDPIQSATVTQTANGGGSTKFPVGLPSILYTYNGFSPENATTNANGVVSFTVLRGLDYNVCAVEPITQVDVCAVYKPTSDTSSLTLTTQAHYTISGHVSDRAGNPAPNAHYVLKSETSGNEIPVVTDANGDYSVNVVADKYALTRDPNNNPYKGFNILAPENTYFIDATSSNAVRDFQYDTVALNVSFVDQNGNPIQSATITQTASGGGATKFPVGLPNVLYTYNGFSPESKTTGSNGTVGYTVLRGLDYNVCAVDPATQVQYCITNALKMTSDTNTLVISNAKPLAPSLSAQSPTKQTPMLTWNAVSGAVSYDVYRDNSKIASVTNTTYSDTAVSQGSYSYYVKVNNNTGLVSDPSNSKTVIYDTTTPTASAATMSTTLILTGASVNLSATVSDNLSGVVGGEFYIDTDPGIGMGTAMTYGNNKINASTPIGGLTLGSHTLYMRSKDAAGNWSNTTSIGFIYLRLL